MKKPVYARGTTISVAATNLEVERVVIRYGGDRYRYYPEPLQRRGVYTFAVRDRNVWLSISYGIPHFDKITGRDLTEQKLRARYRAAFKGIHMRFEQIEAGIETPAEAFHAHIIDPKSGKTLFELTQHLLPGSSNDPPNAIRAS